MNEKETCFVEVIGTLHSLHNYHHFVFLSPHIATMQNVQLSQCHAISMSIYLYKQITQTHKYV